MANITIHSTSWLMAAERVLADWQHDPDPNSAENLRTALDWCQTGAWAMIWDEDGHAARVATMARRLRESAQVEVTIR